MTAYKMRISDWSSDVALPISLDRFGRIDELVNNAGYGQLGLFEENEPGEIERQFAINVFGTFHVTRAVLPVLRRQRRGHIFNLSSMGGALGFLGASAYCATTLALEGFRSEARRVGKECVSTCRSRGLP